MKDRSALRLLAVFFLAALSAFAQLNGRLTGSVVDQSGAPIPGATVNVFVPNGSTAILTTTTSSDGLFAFGAVRPDSYDLAIEAPGFTKHITRGVKVDPSRETALVAITMEIQAAQQTVEVTSAAPSIQTTTSEVSQTVTQRQIQDLPVLDRQVSSLFLTQAGVSEGRGPAVVNGMRTSFANVTLDGINIQDNFIRTNALDYIPTKTTIEQVAEMTISTSNSDPSLGPGGAQLALSTKSGTNEFHGSAYWYNRNSYFAANDWFNNKADVQRPFLNQNQPGASIGGHIIKDKLFFFTNYEAFRLRQQSPTTNTVLTPDARTGIFTYVETKSGVTHKVNVLGLKNAQIDPAIGALLSALPAAGNSSDVGDGRNTTGYAFNARSNEDRNQLVGKIDYYLSSRHSFSTMYNYTSDKVDRPDLGNFYTTVPPVYNDNHNHLLSTSWRWMVSPTITNELRGGFNLGPGNFKVDNQPKSLITNLDFTSPVNAFLNQGRATDTYSLQDNATWVKGKHTVYFGYQSQYIRTAPFNDAASSASIEGITTAANIIPSYVIGISTANKTGLTTTDLPGISSSDLNAANALYASLAGITMGYAQGFNVKDQTSGFVPGYTNIRHFAYDNYAGYVRDNYRFNPRLTLNLGLRYDFYTTLRERDGLYLTPELKNGNYIQTLADPNAVLNYAGNSKRPFYNKDLNNFAPSVGFAYDLFGNGKTAIRGSYGIFYVNDEVITAVRNNVGTSSGLVGVTTATGLSTPASAVPSVNPPPFQIPRTLADNYALDTSSATGMPDPNLRTPYVQQYSLGIQREIKNSVLEVRYVGNHSIKLLRAIDYNQVNIDDQGFLADFKRARSNAFLSLAATNKFDARYNPVIPGSQQLTVFPKLASGGLLTNSTILSYIRSGQIGTLAQVYQTNGLNGDLNFFPNPNVLGANAITNGASSNYNGLQVDFRHRTSSWLQWQVNYTFSKALGDAAGNDQNRFEPLLDLNNPSLERAPEPFDIRHVFKGNYAIDLPFGKGRHYAMSGVLDYILGGWTTSGNFTWQSGTAFSVLSARGTLNRGSRSALNTAISTAQGSDLTKHVGLFMTGNGPYFIDPSVIGSDGRGVASDGSPAFNGQIFFNPGPGEVGSLQRRSFYGPNYSNFDAALMKTFHITERHTLQFRAEAFNLPNHPAFFAGNETSATYANDFNINATTFGKIIHTLNSPRVMQFSLYYRF